MDNGRIGGATRDEEIFKEYELKFTLANPLVPAVDIRLRSVCQLHPEFGETVISSVYYDTHGMRFLNAKVNSDYLKSKVRLRWYSDENGVQKGTPAFVEAKFRSGTQRHKVRFELPWSAAEWANEPLDSELYSLPLECLRSHGILCVNQLEPVLQVTYQRTRYFTPFSGCTLCLDREICSPRVYPGRLLHAHSKPLSYAVLEQKGHLDRLDPVFGDFARYGLRKTAFSKYLACYLHLSRTVL